MQKPQGTLTAAQHEILSVIWAGNRKGSTVTEIWQSIAGERNVTRTTVLNQVDRLEKRGWLQRRLHSDGYRYVATQSQRKTTRGIAEEFLDSFFGGSASELMISLTGSSRLKPSEVSRLREILEENETPQDEKD